MESLSLMGGFKMVKNYDKPEYIDVKREDKSDPKNPDKAISLIKEIVKGESFGVLATNGDNESYTSLISYASNEDVSRLVFATPRDTKKFHMIQNNKSVSILIDNRSSNKESINDIVAITSMGHARTLVEKSEIDHWSKLLLDKHSYLDDFIDADTTGIILVDVNKYYYVSSFQEVVEWSPNKTN